MTTGTIQRITSSLAHSLIIITTLNNAPPGDSPYSSPSIKNHIIIIKIYSNSTLKTTSSSTIKIAIQDLS